MLGQEGKEAQKEEEERSRFVVASSRGPADPAEGPREAQAFY